MTTEEKFKKSENTVKTLKKRPSNDELLKLYALFKQATQGDVSGSRPSLINVKARAKWDAWKELSGKSHSGLKRVVWSYYSQFGTF